MTGARPMFPRAANTRGPPNRMVINNPTVHHPRHTLNRPLTDLEKMSSFRSPSVFEPWDAQSFSAQLKAQQNELHNKIESLKALEQKIQSVPTLPSHIRQDGPPMIPQVYRASPIVQTDYRKRKIKPIVPGSGQISDKFRKISPHVGATGKPPASEETCVVCKEKAYFVCSGCHGIWYCSKYCQFQDWTSHSKSCISQLSQV
uniref:MYND-type domain-containing protein n=1 Tax=Ciona savignyi TaxID=51511 RepID=H2YUU2_CIOSA